MFQNIESASTDFKNVKKEPSFKNVNVFSNIFTKNNIILYIFVFLISTIGVGQDVSPFSLAVVAACIAASIPILGVVIVGFIGNIIAFGTAGALNYMVMLLVLILSFFVINPKYNEETKNEKIKISLNLFISILLIGILKIIISEFTIYNILVEITFAIISVIFYKIFVNSLVVIQEFNEKKAFSIEEVIGASLFISIGVAALGDFSIYGFSIRNILSILIVMILGWKNGILVGTTAGVTIGVTLGVIAEFEPIMIAAFAISGMIAGILNKFGKIGVIVGFILGNGVLAYISNGWTADLIIFREILIASIGLLAMPKNISINIEEFTGGKNLFPVSPMGALNKSKEKETADRLNSVSEAIQDMANTYKIESLGYTKKQEFQEENKNIFISELLTQLDLKKDNMLYDDLTQENSKILEEIFNVLLEKQNINRKDLLKVFAGNNSYIVGFEDKEVSKFLEKNIEEIISVINNAYKISKSNFVMQKKIKETKNNISAQLGEVSKAISNIAKDIKKDIKSEELFNNQKQEIIALINQLDVKVNDLHIKEEKSGRCFVDVFVDVEELSNNKIEKIKKIVCNIIKKDLVLQEINENTHLSFITEDKFILNIGIANSVKKGNDISGDNIIKLRLKDGKYLIAISDGMGSGETANKSSKIALNMLKKLLESGFDKDTSIELINTTILNSTDDIYATLDVAIVDLYKGNIEFIKNGACPTYIKNKKKVEMVKSVSLPAGVLKNVKLSAYDKDINSEDILVMCSDGILDSNVEYKNKELWLKYLLEDLSIEDSQKIADIILNEAIDNSYGVVKDDMSIIVCKFIKNTLKRR